MENAEYNTRAFILALIAKLRNTPKTAYGGYILSRMPIVIINDINPVRVDYKDPSPEAYRPREFIENYCGGAYHPTNWVRPPTMAVTSTGSILIGEQFLEDVFKDANTDDEAVDIIRGVLLHESMHISEASFIRAQHSDIKIHDIWNIATDAYINNILLKNGFSLPSDCIRPGDNEVVRIPLSSSDPQQPRVFEFDLKGKTAEELYFELEKFLSEDPSEQQEPQQERERPLQKGDVIWDEEQGTYGVVLSVDGDQIKHRAISEDEAFARVGATK